MPDLDYSGHVAVVTGGSQGIGAAVARAYALAGARVAVLFRSDADAAAALAAAVGADGGTLTTHQVDVADLAAMKECLGRVQEAHGHPDILVNNAGVARDGFLMTAPERNVAEVLDTNLRGAIIATKVALPSLVARRGGHVLNISSVAGLRGTPAQTLYAASKAGLIGFTRALAREMARFHVQVNCIAPGMIETRMTAKLSGRIREQYLEQIPLGRFAQPSEVADLALFLTSDRNRYMTGETVVMDGGLSS